MLRRTVRAGMFALLILAPGPRGFDWQTDLPFDIGFQVGFSTEVVLSVADMSEALGLSVCVEELITDRKSSLTVTGTIVNTGSFTVEGVSMGFAVTSYVGVMADRATAFLDTDVIPPGGTARFTMRVVLGSEHPRWAVYTVSAANVIAS